MTSLSDCVKIDCRKTLSNKSTVIPKRKTLTMSRTECSAIVMNTSIGSDGERSECGSPDSVSPPQTPSSITDKRYENDSSLIVASSRKLVAQNLSFSIDNILRPDFGHPPKFQCASGSNSRSASIAPNSPNYGSSGSVGSQSSAPQLLWPAWVYCTRYSDRPSSGSKISKLFIC